MDSQLKHSEAPIEDSLDTCALVMHASMSRARGAPGTASLVRFPSHARELQTSAPKWNPKQSTTILSVTLERLTGR